MPLIKVISPEKATGGLKEMYDKMKNRTGGIIPKPFRMMSASPELLNLMNGFVNYYSEKTNVSFEALAFIRLLVSKSLGYDYCLEFNAGMLQMFLGLTDEKLTELLNDPNNLPLKEKEKALVLFVLKGVTKPSETTKNDVKKLHKCGWTDKDILEASYHGADMIKHGTLFKMLKMDELP